jgi:hypothetical protein
MKVTKQQVIWNYHVLIDIAKDLESDGLQAMAYTIRFTAESMQGAYGITDKELKDGAEV